MKFRTAIFRKRTTVPSDSFCLRTLIPRIRAFMPRRKWNNVVTIGSSDCAAYLWGAALCKVGMRRVCHAIWLTEARANFGGGVTRRASLMLVVVEIVRPENTATFHRRVHSAFIFLTFSFCLIEKDNLINADK